MRYRIIESTYNDEYGKETQKVYYIDVEKNFLGIFKYWKRVTHKVGGMSGTYNTWTPFKTSSDAHDFVLTTLCGNNHKDDWKEKVVSDFYCD